MLICILIVHGAEKWNKKETLRWRSCAEGSAPRQRVKVGGLGVVSILYMYIPAEHESQFICGSWPREPSVHLLTRALAPKIRSSLFRVHLCVYATLCDVDYAPVQCCFCWSVLCGCGWCAFRSPGGDAKCQFAIYAGVQFLLRKFSCALDILRVTSCNFQIKILC